MTTSESHGAISGSRVSAERLAEMLAVCEGAQSVGIGDWIFKRDGITFDTMRAILTELQSLRSEPSEPVAWLKEWADEAGNPRKRVDLHPQIETWLDRYSPSVTPLYASPQPGASS